MRNTRWQVLDWLEFITREVCTVSTGLNAFFKELAPCIDYQNGKIIRP